MRKIYGDVSFHLERLIVRPLDMRDAENLYHLRSNKENMTFVGMAPYKDITRAKRFIENVSKDIEIGEVCFWAIASLETNQLIGTICLWNFTDDFSEGEVGYELFPHAQGFGYMLEALTRVIDYAFETVGLSQINAITHRNHEASIKLLNRLGFSHRGTYVDIDPQSDENPDMQLYALRKK